MYTKFETFILRDDGASIPLDGGNIDYLAYLAWIEAGNEPALPPPATFQERSAGLLAAVDEHLNSAARSRGYDSILSAALRAALPLSPFHAEGLAFGNWMDSVYAKCYEVLAAVKGGEVDEPTFDELLTMLPALKLPQ